MIVSSYVIRYVPLMFWWSFNEDTKEKYIDLKCKILKFSFTPNVNQIVKYNISTKSDTFPPDKHADPQLPNYQSVNTSDSKHRPYSPIELPPEFQYCNDQAIIDSAKRVLEWQKKNSDVISKENKLKDNKIYQPINSHASNDSRLQKVNYIFGEISSKLSSFGSISRSFHYFML